MTHANIIKARGRGELEPVEYIKLTKVKAMIDNMIKEEYDWYHTYGKVKVWAECSQPDIFVEDFARFVLNRLKEDLEKCTDM